MLKTIAKLLAGALVVLFTVIGTIAFVQENMSRSSRLITYNSQSKVSNGDEETETESELTSLNINGKTYLASLPNEVAGDPEEAEATDELKQAGQEYLSTRELTPEANSSLDLAAIQNGDYASIVGNWGNEAGYLLQFAKDGISLPADLTLSDFNIGEANEVIATVTSTSGISFFIRFYPAGVQIPASSLALTTEDPTDYNRDRIVVTRINRLDFDSTESLVNRVYYKLETATEEPAEEATAETEAAEPVQEEPTTKSTESTESTEQVEQPAETPEPSSEPQETIYTSSYQAPETGGVTTLIE